MGSRLRQKELLLVPLCEIAHGGLDRWTSAVWLRRLHQVWLIGTPCVTSRLAETARLAGSSWLQHGASVRGAQPLDDSVCGNDHQMTWQRRALLFRLPMLGKARAKTK